MCSLFICLGTFPFFARAIEPIDFTEFSFQVSDNYTVSIESAMGTGPLGRQFLLDHQDQFTDYQSFLSLLKSTSPQMFSRPVLLHHSGSLQPASFENPRVILFGRGTMMSFAEGGAEEFRAVEILEYDEAKAEFLATEIVFPLAGQPQIRTNPQSCKGCHGQPLRPIWTPYDFWPKAYHAFASSSNSDKEQQAFENFVNGEHKGIYQHLDFDVTEGGRLPNNDTFTQFVFALNTHRMMSDWRRVEALQPYRYLLAATLNRCTVEDPFGRNPLVPIARYFPEETYSEFAEDVSPDQYVRQGQYERTRMLEFVESRYLQIFPYMRRELISRRMDFFVNPIAHTRFVLERLGLQWRQYTMSYGENDFDMNIPGNSMIDLATSLSIFNQDMFQELQPEIETMNGLQYPISYVQLDCLDLQSKSLESLVGAETPELHPFQIQDSLAGLSPMAKCVKCHASSSSFTPADASMIPFDDSTALSQWLNTKKNFAKTVRMIETGKMPEQSSLTTEEKNGLIRALERLKSLKASNQRDEGN